MNRVFVSIKVDREERPDLDSIYMDVAFMLNRRGGWPLNLILTPDGKPFFAATYIPKEGNQFGIGMMDLIPKIEEAWLTRRSEVIAAGDQIIAALKDRNTESSSNFKIDLFSSNLNMITGKAFSQLEDTYEPEYGGFAAEPKFPQAHIFLFLLRFYHETGNTEALRMVEHSLRNMRTGGIYDHIGFGFHRYSTDKEWKLPHFEKMLYDQAMLILAYSEAYLVTGDKLYKNTANEVISYVLRDMTSKEGGFYSAEDADSEGVEGKFYLWDYDEIAQLLGPEAEEFSDYYNLNPGGNNFDEASGTKPGDNILYLKPGSEISVPGKNFGGIRELLFNERELRMHPHKDDKILTDWNGLMIYALARAAWIFDDAGLHLAGKKAADFILSEMKQNDGSLLHEYRDGESGTSGMFEDYAFFIRALLELYRSDFDPKYLEEAIGLV